MSYDVVKGCESWDYHVVDTLSENEPVAGFFNQDMANSYCEDLNRHRSLSCCKTSISTSGWHHDHDCKGVYEKPVIFTKYRIYLRNGNPTFFKQVAHNEYRCTHGGWSFKEDLNLPRNMINIPLNDEPVEYDEMIEFNTRLDLINSVYGGDYV